MITRNILFFIIILLSTMPGVSYAGPPSESGFFQGEVNFEQHPIRSNVYRYIKKDVNFGNYNQVNIAPVEIWLHPDSSYKGVQASTIKAISDQLRHIVITALGEEYPVVNRTGEGTIGVRLAITGVKLHRQKRSFISYMPIGMASAAIQDDMLSRTELSDAIIEAELIDSQSGERIAAFVDRNMAADLRGNSHQWDEIEEAFEYYAKRFRKHLDAAR